LETDFQIDLHVACHFPRYLRPHVRRAAKKALGSIPAAIARRLLRPGLRYRLSLSVVSPRAIRKLNQQYRGKDKPTDVLSFSRLVGKIISPEPDLGDVVLCWEIAKSQTADFGTTRRSEVQRLVVHGILHLFGFDHERGPADARRMFTLQERILKTL
jgi:probable rRNA maturation factor